MSRGFADRITLQCVEPPRFAKPQAAKQSSHLLPSADRVGQDISICVFDVASGRQAARQAGDLHLRKPVGNQILNVQRGAVPFEVRIRPHDQLANPPSRQAIHQRIDGHILRMHIIQRRDSAQQNVIDSLV